MFQYFENSLNNILTIDYIYKEYICFSFYLFVCKIYFSFNFLFQFV